MSAVKNLHADLNTIAALTKKVLESVQHQAVSIRDVVNARDDNQRLPTSAGGQPHELVQVLVERDRVLQENLKNLEKHQEFQSKIVHVQQECQKRTEALSSLVNSLKNAEEKLMESTEKGRKRLKKLREGLKNPVQPDDLVHYARKVSYTMSAPPGYKEGDNILPRQPPAPQELMIRMGSLYTKMPDTEVVAAATEERERKMSQPDAYGTLAFSPRRSPTQRKRNLSTLFGLDIGGGASKQARVEAEESSNSTSEDESWE